MVGRQGGQLTAAAGHGGDRLPAAPQPSPLGLYLHIPFCASICAYCNFNRGLLDEGLKARYVDALAREIASYADGADVDTVYFGGGTPSLLTATELDMLLRACRDAFTIDDGAEITLEVNPESATVAHLAALRAAGVNRLSIGVQSFDDAELVRLGRVHSADGARAAVAHARAAGFDNISLDLMMWLPGQTLDTWMTSVERLIDVGPEHASLYLLEIYPNAPLRDEMARQGWSVAPDETAADMYVSAMARLESAGYRQYEISNVARDGRWARHNVKYWTDGEWLGLGCGAHGTRAGVRWRNTAATAEYVAAVMAARSVRTEERVLTPEVALSEAAFMGLRLMGGLRIGAINMRYDCDIMARFGAELARCAEAGLLALEPDCLRLTPAGRLLANEVLAVFV